MNDKIILQGLKVWAYHGVMASERELGQPFSVDLEMWLPLQIAAQEDNLADTVDYGEVIDMITKIMAAAPCRLLESLAENIARALLTEYSIRQVKVRVKKPRVPLPVSMEYAAVEVCRDRDDYGLPGLRKQSRQPPTKPSDSSN